MAQVSSLYALLHQLTHATLLSCSSLTPTPLQHGSLSLVLYHLYILELDTSKQSVTLLCIVTQSHHVAANLCKLQLTSSRPIVTSTVVDLARHQFIGQNRTGLMLKAVSDHCCYHCHVCPLFVCYCNLSRTVDAESWSLVLGPAPAMHTLLHW